MSVAHNEIILERLYDEAWEELFGDDPDMHEDMLHEKAVAMAHKRFEDIC